MIAFPRLTLRFLVPLALFGVLSFLTLVGVSFGLYFSLLNLQRDHVEYLSELGEQLVSGLDDELAGGLENEAAREFRERTQQDNLQAAVIFDARGQVRFNSNNSPLEPDLLPHLLQQPADPHGHHVLNHGERIELLMPVVADPTAHQGYLYLAYDLRQKRQQAQRTALLELLAILLAGAAGSGLLWRLMDQRVTQRVNALQMTLLQLSAGQLQARTREDGSDELGQIARTVNLLAQARVDQELLASSQQQLLNQSQARYRTLFESSQDFIAFFDLKGQLIEGNPAFLRMLGYSGEEAQQLSYFSISLEDEAVAETDPLQHALTRLGHTGLIEKHFRGKDGRITPVSMRAILLRDASGAPEQICGIGRDITAMREAQAQLHLAAKVFEVSHEGIAILDPSGRIVSANPSFSRIGGFSLQQSIGKRPSEVMGGDYDPTLLQEILRRAHLDGLWQDEFQGRRPDGQPYPLSVSMAAVVERGQPSHYIMTFSDISERKASQAHIRHLAEHDFLTNLPNRVLLLDRLNQALEMASRHQSQFALLYIDLDHFKQINDSLGHHCGDLLLQAVALRLSSCLRSSDTVSRQGGDEFVLLLPEIDSADSVAQVCRMLMDTLTASYQLEQHELQITASIGISLYPLDGTDLNSLMKHADTAMYHAKQHGRNSYQFFTEAMNIKVSERALMQVRLARALEQGEFRVFYQPKVALDSGMVIGAEALIRWQDPELGLISPARFIPVAEESGQIVAIGTWVLQQACLQARRWLEAGQPLVVSVNLSPVQFLKGDVQTCVRQALSTAELAAQWLDLEITEGVLMVDTAHAAEAMHSLCGIGVQLSLDDFGTGYSSLSYLKRLPFNTLKIDQSFVRELPANQEDAAMVCAILAMAKSLKMRTIAEGVETPEQLEFLRAQQCDEYQGYYFAKPLPIEEFDALLREINKPCSR
jgi:diguanylate cyclase (GGDEF)-like protein/PAS domain S-box-containing protein